MKIRDKEVDTVQALDLVFGSGYKNALHINAPRMKKGEGEIQSSDFHESFLRAKRFLIDFVIPQNAYGIRYAKEKHRQMFHILPPSENLMMPFQETLIAFSEPIEILWSPKEKVGSDGIYNIQKLVAVLVREIEVKEPALKEKVQKNNMRVYRMYLVFFEDDPTIDRIVLGNQYIDYFIRDIPIPPEKVAEVVSVMPEGVEVRDVRDASLVHHVRHLCSDRENCWIGNDGDVKTEKAGTLTKFDDVHYCQEYANRKSVLDMISFVVNSIIQKEVIEKKVEHRNSFARSILDDLLSGKTIFGGDISSYSKGAVSSIPSPYYSMEISNKRYKYAPEDIALGTGTKHRFRYDVRKHPRIVKDKIVWIEPHQRGHGEYIPKLYTKSVKGSYIMEIVESATSVRFIERIVIAFIRIWRKWHGRK